MMNHPGSVVGYLAFGLFVAGWLWFMSRLYVGCEEMDKKLGKYDPTADSWSLGCWVIPMVCVFFIILTVRIVLSAVRGEWL